MNTSLSFYDIYILRGCCELRCFREYCPWIPSQVTPPRILSDYCNSSPVYILGGEEQCKSKVSCPRTQQSDPSQGPDSPSPPKLRCILSIVS